MSAELLSLEETALRFDTLIALAEDGMLIGEEDRRMLSDSIRIIGGLSESEKTAGYAVKHAPIGKGGKNWVTADKPGGKGQLPAYIQNVRNAIMRGGTEESRATAIAIGRIRDWAEGKGDVSPEVRAAAGKAISQWEAMKARAKGKGALKESVEGPDGSFGSFWLEYDIATKGV